MISAGGEATSTQMKNFLKVLSGHSEVLKETIGKAIPLSKLYIGRQPYGTRWACPHSMGGHESAVNRYRSWIPGTSLPPD